MSVLGIDVGTSTCKGIVLSSAGQILAQAYQNYAQKPTIHDDKAEIDAEVFKDGVFAVIKKLATAVKDSDAIQAIAFSTHGETLVPVDENGKPYAPCHPSTYIRRWLLHSSPWQELQRSGKELRMWS